MMNAKRTFAESVLRYAQIMPQTQAVAMAMKDHGNASRQGGQTDRFSKRVKALRDGGATLENAIATAHRETTQGDSFADPAAEQDIAIRKAKYMRSMVGHITPEQAEEFARKDFKKDVAAGYQIGGAKLMRDQFVEMMQAKGMTPMQASAEAYRVLGEKPVTMAYPGDRDIKPSGHRPSDAAKEHIEAGEVEELETMTRSLLRENPNWSQAGARNAASQLIARRKAAYRARGTYPAER